MSLQPPRTFVKLYCLVWSAHRALCTPIWPAERTVWPQTASRIHIGCIKGRGTSLGPRKNCHNHNPRMSVMNTQTDTMFALIYRIFNCVLVPFSFLLVWLMPLAQVWTDYKIGKLNVWRLFCDVCIHFLNNQIWKEIMLELNGKPSKCCHVLNWFFLPKPGFWEFIWIFSGRSISPTF
jgi:hypothetical protein